MPSTRTKISSWLNPLRFRLPHILSFVDRVLEREDIHMALHPFMSDSQQMIAFTFCLSILIYMRAIDHESCERKHRNVALICSKREQQGLVTIVSQYTATLSSSLTALRIWFLLWGHRSVSMSLCRSAACVTFLFALFTVSCSPEICILI